MKELNPKQLVDDLDYECDNDKVQVIKKWFKKTLFPITPETCEFFRIKMTHLEIAQLNWWIEEQ